MQNIQIWHNPRCSKSRSALELLQTKGINVNVVKYLETIPTKEQLKDILSKLKISAKELLRTGENIYKELNLKDIMLMVALQNLQQITQLETIMVQMVHIKMFQLLVVV